MVTAAPRMPRSARIRAIASASSAGATARTLQRASIPAAAKPALKRLAAGSPSPSPPSSSSRVWPLLEAVLLEEANELFVGLRVVVVALGVRGGVEVPGVPGVEGGTEGFDCRVGDRARGK